MVNDQRDKAEQARRTPNVMDQPIERSGYSGPKQQNRDPNKPPILTPTKINSSPPREIHHADSNQDSREKAKHRVNFEKLNENDCWKEARWSRQHMPHAKATLFLELHKSCELEWKAGRTRTCLLTSREPTWKNHPEAFGAKLKANHPEYYKQRKDAELAAMEGCKSEFLNSEEYRRKYILQPILGTATYKADPTVTG